MDLHILTGYQLPAPPLLNQHDVLSDVLCSMLSADSWIGNLFWKRRRNTGSDLRILGEQTSVIGIKVGHSSTSLRPHYSLPSSTPHLKDKSFGLNFFTSIQNVGKLFPNAFAHIHLFLSKLPSLLSSFKQCVPLIFPHGSKSRQDGDCHPCSPQVFPSNIAASGYFWMGQYWDGWGTPIPVQLCAVD